MCFPYSLADRAQAQKHRLLLDLVFRQVPHTIHNEDSLSPVASYFKFFTRIRASTKRQFLFKNFQGTRFSKVELCGAVLVV